MITCLSDDVDAALFDPASPSGDGSAISMTKVMKIEFSGQVNRFGGQLPSRPQEQQEKQNSPRPAYESYNKISYGTYSSLLEVTSKTTENANTGKPIHSLPLRVS